MPTTQAVRAARIARTARTVHTAQRPQTRSPPHTPQAAANGYEPTPLRPATLAGQPLGDAGMGARKPPGKAV